MISKNDREVIVIRVLVVDDSAFMRKALSRMLEADPEIRVVGTARDGLEALAKVEELDPDLVTLDVEMPRMDGLETLSRLMQTHPRPVLMVSSLTEEGAEVTLKALDLGALDYIPKGISGNVLEVIRIEQVLREKVKALARKKKPTPVRAVSHPPRRKDAPARRLGPARWVAIGASTGGPPALQKIFTRLPEDLAAPIVIVQHMPAAFTPAFARRLDSVSPLRVKEAQTGDRLEPGHAFLAPGGKHMVVHRDGSRLVLEVTEKPADTLHKPSVDVTFDSVAREVGGQTLAVILTGMGADGTEGVRAIKNRGGWAVAQDAASCVVYGMPRSVVEAGLADAVVPLDRIAPLVAEAVG